MSNNVVTRSEYLSGKVTHGEYYAAVAKTAGIVFNDGAPIRLSEVRQSLSDGDDWLNNISLKRWDAWAFSLINVAHAFKAHGDADSLAGRVCMLKQVARDAAKTCKCGAD